jgi:hypothetical protein
MFGKCAIVRFCPSFLIKISDLCDFFNFQIYFNSSQKVEIRHLIKNFLGFCNLISIFARNQFVIWVIEIANNI